MDFVRFNQLTKLLLNDEFVLSYSGYVSEDILRAVGDTLRERLSSHVSDNSQIRNIFSIFVELMQNIIRYGDDGPQPIAQNSDEKPSFGIVLVSQSDNGLSVMAGNYVSPEEAALLTERITGLAQSTPEELRQMYRDKLREPVEETSKGASLGLIEIARRASLPLTCETISDDTNVDTGADTGANSAAKNYSLFMIKATV